ncbi:MAG: HNH endonuclease family protein, partial [Granulicella sp.]
MRMISTNPEETKKYFESIGLPALAKHQDRFVEAHETLLALKQFNVLQAHPVIFAAILCIRRLKLQKDSETARSFVRLLKGLESYHFINTYVCSHIGNEVEHLYADSCKAFGSAAKFGLAVDKLVSELRKKRAPLNEFRENFVQIEYSEKNTGKLSYIFDRHNNYGRKVGERKAIFYPDVNMFRRHYNVEHIEPQNPPQSLDTSVPSARLNNIGNLTILTTQLNSSLGNKSAKEKFTLMKGPLAKRIAELPALVSMNEKYGNDTMIWNDLIIESRARDLAEFSYQKVWPL